MTFAERLKQLREKAGMTQEGLARTCTVSVGAIKNYEQGIREPTWRGIFKLAEALGVSVEAFKDCVADVATEAPARPAKASGKGKAGEAPAEPGKRARKKKA
jgi:transcriptional regulator with XRE-family HTH domain